MLIKTAFSLDQLCIVVNQASNSAESFPKNGGILIYRVFDNLLHIFPGLANLSRRGVAKEKLLNAFQRMSLEDLRNPQFEIPVLSNNVPENKASKTAVSIQIRSGGLKSLPVIEENESAINAKTAKIEIKNAKIAMNKSLEASFSKVHTKESEINSSFDINSSFKSIPASSIISKNYNKFVFNLVNFLLLLFI